MRNKNDVLGIAFDAVGAAIDVLSSKWFACWMIFSSIMAFGGVFAILFFAIKIIARLFAS